MRARVLIADDHATVRAGLCALLEPDRYQVVAEAQSGDEILEILATTAVDVLITDLAMPSASFADGLAYLSAVIGSYPQLPVVVLTMLRRPAILQSARRMGIGALVDKSSSLDEVTQALQRVLAGKRHVSASLVELMGEADTNSSSSLSVLSPRERQILMLLGQGNPVGQVARRLGTSPNTVSMQKSSLMRKLGLRSNADLIDYIRHHTDSGVPS